MGLDEHGGRVDVIGNDGKSDVWHRLTDEYGGRVDRNLAKMTNLGDRYQGKLVVSSVIG